MASASRDGSVRDLDTQPAHAPSLRPVSSAGLQGKDAEQGLTERRGEQARKRGRISGARRAPPSIPTRWRRRQGLVGQAPVKKWPIHSRTARAHSSKASLTSRARQSASQQVGIFTAPHRSRQPRGPQFRKNIHCYIGGVGVEAVSNQRSLRLSRRWRPSRCTMWPRTRRA